MPSEDFLVTLISPVLSSKETLAVCRAYGEPYSGTMIFWMATLGMPTRKLASSSSEEMDSMETANRLLEDVTRMVSPLLM